MPDAILCAEKRCGDFERAIRLDERRRIAQLLDGDARRLAHLLGRVLSAPSTTYDERQRAARILPKEKRTELRRLLDGDMRRLSLFLAALVQEIDPDWKDPDA